MAGEVLNGKVSFYFSFVQAENVAVPFRHFINSRNVMRHSEGRANEHDTDNRNRTELKNY